MKDAKISELRINLPSSCFEKEKAYVVYSRYLIEIAKRLKPYFQKTVKSIFNNAYFIGFRDIQSVEFGFLFLFFVIFLCVCFVSNLCVCCVIISIVVVSILLLSKKSVCLCCCSFRGSYNQYFLCL